MDDGPALERRRWPRRTLGVVVDVLEEVRGKYGRAVGMDIGRGGMRLKTLLDYREGDRITVDFLLPGAVQRIVVTGRVTRVVTPEEFGPEAAGVAIEFIDVPDWAMDEVIRFVEGEDACLGVGAVVKSSD